MKLRTAALVAFFAFLLVGSFVFLRNRTTRKYEQIDTASLRLQWVHQAQFAGFYVAKEKGFYQQRRINLQIGAGGQDFNVPLLVAQRREDFGLWVGDHVLEARDKQMPIRAIGTVFNRSLACFMVKQGSPIFTPKDFEGKVVGVYFGFDTETIYRDLITRFHVNHLTIKEYPAAYTIVPFLQGAVDVWPSYVINEPLAARESGQQVRLLKPEDYGIRYYSDTLIVNETTLRDKRDLVMRFLEASEKGWRYALSHPDEAINIVLKYDPSLKEGHERQMLSALAPYINATEPLFAMDPETWKAMGEVLQRQGAIRDVNVFQGLCDFRIAAEAHLHHEE